MVWTARVPRKDKRCLSASKNESQTRRRLSSYRGRGTQEQGKSREGAVRCFSARLKRSVKNGYDQDDDVHVASREAHPLLPSGQLSSQLLNS